MRAFLVLDLALPIALASEDEHLLGVRRHAAIEILLPLNVQACRHLAALACRRGAGLDDWEGRRWTEGIGDPDLRAFKRVPSPREAFRERRLDRCRYVNRTVAEDGHDAGIARTWNEMSCTESARKKRSTRRQT
jgi:hypothetical protein